MGPELQEKVQLLFLPQHRRVTWGLPRYSFGEVIEKGWAIFKGDKPTEKQLIVRGRCSGRLCCWGFSQKLRLHLRLELRREE